MKWSNAALDAIAEVADKRIIRGGFTCEELRHELNVEPPHDGRAYGGVIQRAIKLRLIEPTGEFRLAKSSHNSPKPVYRFVPKGWRK